MIHKIKRWWRSVTTTWKLQHGWTYCPECGYLVFPRFVKDWIVHPEEPPLFGHYYCPHCRHTTAPKASFLMDSAARSHGYKSFEDAMRTITADEKTCKGCDKQSTCECAWDLYNGLLPGGGHSDFGCIKTGDGDCLKEK